MKIMITKCIILILTLTSVVSSHGGVVPLKELSKFTGLASCSCMVALTDCSTPIDNCPPGIYKNVFLIPGTSLPPCEVPLIQPGDVLKNLTCKDLAPHWPQKSCIDMGPRPNQNCIRVVAGTCGYIQGTYDLGAAGGKVGLTAGMTVYFMVCTANPNAIPYWKTGTRNLADGDGTDCPLPNQG